MAMETSHIWLGNFPSKEDYLDYVEETYAEDDDSPINQFAADQGIGFYDTDWEESFYDSSGNLKQLICQGSYSKDYIDDVLKDAKSKKINSANTIIIVDKNEIPSPHSIEKEKYSLTYLGEYHCDTSVPDF